MESNLTEKFIEHGRLQFYKNILSRYAIGEYLTGKDFDAVLNLLKQHPNAEEKIGVGIKDLLVDDSGYGRYGKKCFYLIRQDGTKENFSYLKCLGQKCNFYNKDKPAENKRKPEPEIIRTTSKPFKVVAASKPIPKKSGSDKGVAKATAKAAKITLVLDPASITKVDSTGQKQTKLKINVDAMVFEVDLNSKSYRKALTTIDELGVDNCNAILQGAMKEQGKIEGAGLAVQPKKAKEEPKEEVKQES